MSRMIRDRARSYPDYDLNDGLDEEFNKYANSFWRHLDTRIDEPLKSVSFEFFDKNSDNYELIDEYFGNFVFPWQIALEEQLRYKALRIWKEALNLALEWEERSGKRLHKGLPYYFQGASFILNGNIDQGLLSMHQALKEDEETRGDNPYTPARNFILLDPKENKQAFKSMVEDTSEMLERHMNSYNDMRDKGLCFGEFKSNFLDCPNLRDEAFSVVHGLFKIDQIESKDPYLFGNYLAFKNQTDVLFQFCRVIEVLLEEALLGESVENDSLHEYLTNLVEEEEGFNVDPNKFSEIKERRESDFLGTLEKILAGNYKLRHNSSPTSWEVDIATTKFFRDFGAHYVSPFSEQSTSAADKNAGKVIHENFENIVQRILNVLFLTIELYY